MKNSSPRPNPRLSQNFLVDPNYQRRILAAMDLTNDDVLLEIGPGRGALTKNLLDKIKHLYAVEKDSRLFKLLQEKFKTNSLTLLNKDFLSIDLLGFEKVTKIFGNIPYHISTPIIEKLLDDQALNAEIFLTVQWEFGRRLAAMPNNKIYGRLSCFVQYYSEVEILFTIPAKAFYPQPKVQSCFIRMRKRPCPYQAKNEVFLFHLIQQAFQQRRKKIGNALAGFVDKDRLQMAFVICQIGENLRAENLGLKEYVDLANQLS